LDRGVYEGLLVAGVMLVVIGLLIILQFGGVISYYSTTIEIPYYEFHKILPGNYSEVKMDYIIVAKHQNILLDSRDFTSLGEVNVSRALDRLNGDCIPENVIQIIIGAEANTSDWHLVLRIMGYKDNEWVVIAERKYDTKPITTTMVATISTITYGLSTGDETGFIERGDSIPVNILDYEKIAVEVKPSVKAILRMFDVNIPVKCRINYTIDYPMLDVSTHTKFYTITVPYPIYYRELVWGLLASIIGLTLMNISIYLAVVSRKR